MRRWHGWLIAAILLGAAALLLSLGDGEPARTTRPEVDFPVWMREPERQRAAQRATLVLPAPPPPAGVPADATPAEPPPRRDPFLVALPVEPDAPLIVMEANALRHSRLGERFVACMQQRDPDLFARLERETGIDPLKDVDLVGMAGEAVVLSGFFDRARWDSILEREPHFDAYGTSGRIYRGTNQRFIGTWGDHIIVVASDAAPIQRAIDQLEGRAPVPETGIPEDMAYGELYGVVPGAAAGKLLGADSRGISDRLAALADRIELHVDAMQDVAAVVRVQGPDQAGLDDLARTMGAALAVARVEAEATGDRATADLLEFATVDPGGQGLSLKVAVPAARLEALLGDCERRRPARPP